MVNGKSTTHGEADMKGWLFKWTNYLKGYQRRWFVLNNGLLSYYRNQEEMDRMCRGSINLHRAIIHTTEDSCTFVISNGGAQTFHIKAASEVERQRWVTALELAKANALHLIENETSVENTTDNGKIEVAHAIKMLNNKLEDLKNCNYLVTKHGASLQRSLTELESIDNATDSLAKVKEINERATLFRITSNGMINTSLEYLELAESQGKKWQRMLQHEREQRIQLEEMVEQLAREQAALEKASKPLINTSVVQDGVSSEDDENAEFFDAQCGDFSESPNFRLSHSGILHRSDSFSDAQAFDKLVSEELAADDGSSSDIDDATESAAILTAAIRSSATIKKKGSPDNELDTTELLSARGEMLPVLPENAKKLLDEVRKKPLQHGSQRRTIIPDKPNHHLHIWSIMKNCIGKDLSKIPMPVNFSEPLSMHQKLTEDFEYCSILDAAAKCTDPFERLAYIAAFTISSYSSVADRTAKPFNPLLGETYECDRTEDLGWRAINEQVSHHPPIAAQHCEGRNWVSWREFTMASKFRGKYLQVIPTGTCYLKFKDSDDYYTWSKVTTTVHNIIVGKLWVDQEGEMEIINHKTGYKCHVRYVPYSYFSRDQRKVKGRVTNTDGDVKYLVMGTWDNKVEIAPVTKSEESNIVETGAYREVWQKVPLLEDSNKYYNFSQFACQLNEMEEGIAPTDSRLRPDQRLMELGLWDEANIEKLRLEEKQRQKRKKHFKPSDGVTENGEIGNSGKDYKPCWFRKEIDFVTGDNIYVYGEEYWTCKAKQDWSRCPNIF